MLYTPTLLTRQGISYLVSGKGHGGTYRFLIVSTRPNVQSYLLPAPSPDMHICIKPCQLSKNYPPGYKWSITLIKCSEKQSCVKEMSENLESLEWVEEATDWIAWAGAKKLWTD